MTYNKNMFFIGTVALKCVFWRVGLGEKWFSRRTSERGQIGKSAWYVTIWKNVKKFLVNQLNSMKTNSNDFSCMRERRKMCYNRNHS